MEGISTEFIYYVTFGLLYIVFPLMYVTSSLGLYRITKNFGEKYPWMAFIPYFKLYTYIKSAGYSLGRGILQLVINIIGAFLFLLVLLVVLYKLTLPKVITVSEVSMYLFIFAIFGKILFQNIVMFFLYHGMAKRAGQSKTTAILMTLFPWCMLLIVARRTPDRSAEIQDTSLPQDTSDIAINL